MAPITTTSTPAAWSPDATSFLPTDVVSEALILSASTVAGSIDGDSPAIRVGYLDDDEASFTAEGAEIPESDPTLAEVTISTGKITQLVRVSTEQYSQGGASQMLSDSVRRAIVKKADDAFLNQIAPVAPALAPATGLLEVAGLTQGDPVTDDLDSITDLIAEIGAAGGTPSTILLGHRAWGSLRKMKATAGSAQTLLGAGAADATATLLGIPVRVVGAMPADAGLVVDRSAIVSAVGPVTVATSNDVFFTSDSVALRATWRIGQAVVRPARIGSFSVTAPA